MDASVDPCPIDNMHDAESTCIEFHSGLDGMIENVLDPVSSSYIHLVSHNSVVDNDPIVYSNKGQIKNKASSTAAAKDILTSSASQCQAATEVEHKDAYKEKKLNKVSVSTDPILTQTCPIPTQTNLIATTIEQKVSVSTQNNLVLVFTPKGNQEPKQILGKSKKRKRLDHAFLDSNAFLQWSLEHFNVWIWSAYDLEYVNKCIDTIFLMFMRTFMDIWGRDQCFWNFSIHFKKLAHFWDKNVEYGPDNTLIIDTTTYRLFHNIGRCCLTFPNMTISERLNYLSGTLCDQLWKWLIAPNRIEYADIISRLIPLDEESLSIYHAIHRDHNRDYRHNQDYIHNQDYRQKH
ncbi:hypothetical protein KP509_14G022300 [Ceratopteris richardii]|uniref:FCP1 homology domain-containing protein n=1 Tax=Ceratopteris richardii TaxID=49495 RepID=A0A8T2T670_CERRI|nr:hypothetical protein KP509_14G022300 [Ceratopteris richardii]